MRPKIISFDAAGTLVEQDWQPGRFAFQCVCAAGLELEEQPAIAAYERLLRSRWPHYCEINRSRDDDQCDLFWLEMAQDWLLLSGLPSDPAGQLIRIANERLYGHDQRSFALYPDVLETLEGLQSAGLAMIVLSNWDYSLHRVLRLLGIRHYFKEAFASLQEGAEKPDPRLFEIVVGRLGVRPDEVIHVGDHPVDDLEGARSFGIKAVYLDRKSPEAHLPAISTLRDLGKAIEWHS